MFRQRLPLVEKHLQHTNNRKLDHRQHSKHFNNTDNLTLVVTSFKILNDNSSMITTSSFLVFLTHHFANHMTQHNYKENKAHDKTRLNHCKHTKKPAAKTFCREQNYRNTNKTRIDFWWNINTEKGRLTFWSLTCLVSQVSPFLILQALQDGRSDVLGDVRDCFQVDGLSC